MLDQIHGDDPLQALQTAGTGPVDGDSSESEEDPCESMHSGLKNNSLLGNTKKCALFKHTGRKDHEYQDDEREDDNDTNITDDEENVDVVRICTFLIEHEMNAMKLFVRNNLI